MEENNSFVVERPEHFSAETIYAAKIFERLSPDLRIEILEILRKIQNK